MTFQLFIKTLDYKTRTINVSPTDTVYAVKEKVLQQIDNQLPHFSIIEQVSLIYFGAIVECVKVENNELIYCTLKDYNITKDTTIYCVGRSQRNTHFINVKMNTLALELYYKLWKSREWVSINHPQFLSLFILDKYKLHPFKTMQQNINEIKPEIKPIATILGLYNCNVSYVNHNVSDKPSMSLNEINASLKQLYKNPLINHEKIMELKWQKEYGIHSNMHNENVINYESFYPIDIPLIILSYYSRVYHVTYEIEQIILRMMDTDAYHNKHYHYVAVEKFEPLCSCGEFLYIYEAYKCYKEFENVTCDKCNNKFTATNKVYHCVKGKNEKHMNGFDVCEKCYPTMCVEQINSK